MFYLFQANMNTINFFVINLESKQLFLIVRGANGCSGVELVTAWKSYCPKSQSRFDYLQRQSRVQEQVSLR